MAKLRAGARGSAHDDRRSGAKGLRRSLFVSAALVAARAPHRHALGALALSLLAVAPTFLLADGAWAQTLGGAGGRDGSKTVNGGSIGGTAASPAGGNGGNGGGNTRNGSGAGGGGGAVGGAGGNGGSRGGATPGSVNRV